MKIRKNEEQGSGAEQGSHGGLCTIIFVFFLCLLKKDAYRFQRRKKASKMMRNAHCFYSNETSEEMAFARKE